MWPSFSNQNSAICGQHLALAGDRLAHDDVEGRQAVGRHHQQSVVADRVVVAHLAARQQRQADVMMLDVIMADA